VSYGLAIAADAQADFHTIDIWLQEEVWDELELVAANPSQLAAAPPGHSAIHVFNRVWGGVTYCVIITIVRNDAAKTLTALGITVEQIPHPPMG
jgi:hypothetical protein